MTNHQPYLNILYCALFYLVETIGRKLESLVSLDVPFVLCVVDNLL